MWVNLSSNDMVLPSEIVSPSPDFIDLYKWDIHSFYVFFLQLGIVSWSHYDKIDIRLDQWFREVLIINIGQI